jgi:maltose alpha-D-glucosyltransferase/alpha-amylase
MSSRWYEEAVIYSVEVETFQDSDGDGFGDLQGLAARLDYLARLGVTCLWLNPIHPTPHRDAGYDVADYYGIDSRLGSLGDFVDLARHAEERGIRVLIDLVVNHTSNEHPWFQQARSNPASPYRDWYVWSREEPADRFSGVVFPGEQRDTWSWDERAQAWYFHRFFDFQPDLNWANPAVRDEIKKVMAFWLQLGASGFRVDAAPFVLEQDPLHRPGELDFAILDQWRQHLQWVRSDAVLLCEANVEPDRLPAFTRSGESSQNDRSHMLFAFQLNALLWLALARRSAEPLVTGLRSLPKLPADAQWVTFLRNHDELDLSQLTNEQRTEVFTVFGPSPADQEFGRGIRRRLAPMFRGDQRRMQLAYSLQFTLPGTPMLRYGEEIGMGDLLALPGRDAIRTPMQWERGPRAGFSTARPEDFCRPLSRRGGGRGPRPSVMEEQRNPDSLLRWFGQMIPTLRECPEIGTGQVRVLDLDLPPAVLAHRFDGSSGSLLLLHNLDDQQVSLDLGSCVEPGDAPSEVFADGPYPAPSPRMNGLILGPFGYRWIRMRRRIGRESIPTSPPR